LSDIYGILAASGYEPTIGMEVHVQLNTNTKIFSSDANGMTGHPNAHISAISLGLPGTLPVLNKVAVEKAIMFGLAVNADINPTIYFDRKSYFYPDLPKGYQTTQDKSPICIRGEVEAFSTNWDGTKVQLHHIHLEEDAGKSLHDDPDYTNIDLNRAGAPLIEIVTNPCMKHANVAVAFLQEVRRIVRFLGISEANMEKGELRCDTNISIKKIEGGTLGSKVEIKNMNSFNHVRRAIDFELERQFNLIKDDRKIEVETRTFDPSTGETFGMRFKETLNDYRYFPCPDLPPVEITQEKVASVKARLKKTPKEHREVFRTIYNLSTEDIAQITDDHETAAFTAELIEEVGNAKKAVNWVKGPIRAFCNEKNIRVGELPRAARDIAVIIQMESNSDLTQAAAQVVFGKLMTSEASPLEIARSNDLLTSKDDKQLEQIVSEVLLSLPDEVANYKNGKKQLFGLFMGEVMKKGGRRLDPKQIQALLRKELSK